MPYSKMSMSVSVPGRLVLREEELRGGGGRGRGRGGGGRGCKSCLSHFIGCSITGFGIIDSALSRYRAINTNAISFWELTNVCKKILAKEQ